MLVKQVGDIPNFFPVVVCQLFFQKNGRCRQVARETPSPEGGRFGAWLAKNLLLRVSFYHWIMLILVIRYTTWSISVIGDSYAKEIVL